MKNIVLLVIFVFASVFCHASDRSLLLDSLPKRSKVVTNKNEKLYCSDFAKTKYKLSITGTKIKITRLYKEYSDNYTGTVKNGKIYSNNPDEKSLKDLQGKYYKLEGNNFGVLNIENGDYEWFTECKL